MKKVLILITVGIILKCSIALSAQPVIFFTDLTDGPRSGWEGSSNKGAAVSVWGRNLGDSRGASYVSVGGVNLAQDSDYAEWGTTGHDNGVARGLERITFWLNSGMAIGSGNIIVTVDGVSSDALSFYIRDSGNIYFVSKIDGSDSYNGQYDSYQSGTNGPWQTIKYGRQQISSGDIMYIRNGTYNELDSYNSILYLDIPKNGSENEYTAYVGYPGEFPVLDGTVNGGGGVIRNNYRDTGYTVLSKMKILPSTLAVRVQASTVGHYRIIGLEIDGQDIYPESEAAMVGAINPSDISDITIYGINCHDWGGSKYDHGIYVGNNANGTYLVNFDFGWNEFHDLNNDASGIYIHPKDTDPDNGYADEVDIHDNLLYNLEHAGIHIASRVEDVRIWNNIAYNCGSNPYRGCYQITVSDAITSNIKFYNNIAYSSTDSKGALVVMGYYANVEMRNNIFYSLENSPYINYSYSQPTLFTSDYDLYYGNGVPLSYGSDGYTPTNYLNVDPQFVVEEPNADLNFQIKETSPCKDAGTSTVSSIVATDYIGTSRPRGTGFDIGAYEYDEAVMDTIAPSSVDDLGISNVSEESVTLVWTASGDDGNTGRASGYDIRYSTGLIKGESEWINGVVCTGEPTPKDAGSVELFTVTGLSTGETYCFALKVIDEVNNSSGISNSPYAIAGRFEDLSKVRVYPNPWKKGAGYSSIYITHLTENGEVKIYTISGGLVRELKEQGGIVEWDLKNGRGEAVTSGVYIYLVTDDKGHKKTGKIAVIK